DREARRRPRFCVDIHERHVEHDLSSDRPRRVARPPAPGIQSHAQVLLRRVRMKRLLLFGIALSFVATGCSSSTSPSNTSPTKPTFTATLSTANEVPPITNAEAGGRGDATITFDTTASSVTFVVNLSGFP